MRKIYHLILIKVIILLLVFGFSHISWAAFYAQGGVGAGIDSDRNISVALGYQLDFLVKPRAEIEYLYTRAHYDGNKADMNSVLVNGYLTIPFTPLLDPYVGAGIGHARLNHDDSTMAQGIIGLEYDFTLFPLAVGAEYRYLKLFSETHASKKFDDNIFLIKARYSF